MYGLYLLVHAFESSATMRTRLIAARVIEGHFGGFFFFDVNSNRGLHSA